MLAFRNIAMRIVDRYIHVRVIFCVLVACCLLYVIQKIDQRKRNVNKIRNAVSTNQPLVSTNDHWVSTNQHRVDVSSSGTTDNRQNRHDDVFTVINRGSVFLYRAAFPVGTSANVHGTVSIYGHFRKSANQNNATCCLQYSHNGRVEFREATYSVEMKESCSTYPIHPVALVCDLADLDRNPVGVSLAFGEEACSRSPRDYVTPYQPLQQPRGSLVITTKLIFGVISSEAIIEYVEAYRALGVDKIITYANDDVNPAARRVVDYYAATGYMELLPFEMADAENVQRKFTSERKQVLCDVNLVMTDAALRSAGYEYFGIIDVDEILIPSGNRTLKQLLADLLAQNPNAAGFVFRSKHFYTSWGNSSQSDLILQQYTNTSDEDEPMFERQKYIRLNNRTNPHVIRTHEITPLNGFTKCRVDAKEAYIRHYRSCDRKHAVTVLTRDQCLHEVKRVEDRTVADWSMRIEDRVRRVRKEVFGNHPEENTYLVDFLKRLYNKY